MLGTDLTIDFCIQATQHYHQHGDIKIGYKQCDARIKVGQTRCNISSGITTNPKLSCGCTVFSL